MNTKLVIWFTCICGLLCLVATSTTNDEERLLAEVVSKHDPRARPVLNVSSIVKVELMMSLHQILQVDVNKETFAASFSLSQRWRNELLEWNRTKYNIGDMLVVDSKHIWTPDLYLENNLAEREYAGQMDKLNVKCSITDSGHTMWYAKLIEKVHCDSNVEDFPFDTQTCSFVFSTHAYSMSHIHLFVPQYFKFAGLRTYINHSEWKLVDFTSNRSETYYACCPNDGYQKVSFDIKIKRRSSYYVHQLILPMVFINLLVVCMFLLPALAGARVAVAVLLLLTQILFLLHGSSMIPASYEKPPAITRFFCASMIESTIAIVFLCLATRLHFRKDAVPNCLKRWIIVKLSRYLCTNNGMDNNSREEVQVKFYKTSSDGEINQLLLEQNDHSVEENTHQVSDTLGRILNNLNQNQLKCDREEQWTTIGKTADIILFLAFIFVYIVTISMFVHL